MEVKVVYLCVLLSATLVLLTVYGYLLMTPDDTLRVAVAFPLAFPHQHTSIHVGITNEVDNSVYKKQYLVTMNNKSADSSWLEGTITSPAERSQKTSAHMATDSSVVALTHTLPNNHIPPTTEKETLFSGLTKREEHLLSSTQPAIEHSSQAVLNHTVTRTVTPPTSHEHSSQAVLNHTVTRTVTPPTSHEHSSQAVLNHTVTRIVTPPTSHALQTVLLQQHPTVTMATPPTSHALQYMPQQCRQRYCVEHLSLVEKLVYSKCKKRVPPSVDPSCRCQFVNARGRRVVALVSLPGSGNTWVRGLLERATGVCTGSIYCDKTLRAEGFCGEGLRSGALLVVKTHDSSLQWKGERYKTVKTDRPFFDAAIFLIRSPFRAAIAEWNREVSNLFARNQNGSSHVKYVDKPQFFGKNPVWDKILRSQVVKWKLMVNSNLLRRRSHPVLTVRYEDLKTDAVAEVVRMLDFLEFPYSREEVEHRIREGFTQFYRNHTDSFDHFTTEQKIFVNGIIFDIVQKVQNSKYSALASKLQDYVLR